MRKKQKEISPKNIKEYQIFGLGKKIQVENNIFDRAITKISPTWGLRRLKSRVQMAAAESYTGASKSRSATKKWAYNDGDPVQETIEDLPTLQGRASDLARNNTIGAGVMNSGTTNIVGTGLNLNSQIDSKILKLNPEKTKDLEHKIESEFNSWSEYCEISNKMKLFDSQDLAMRQVFEKGEGLIIFTEKNDINRDYKFRIQFIDVDRLINKDNNIDSNKMAGGIKKNSENGRPEIYYILNRHPKNYLNIKNDKWAEIPAFGEKTGLPNILHIFRTIFPGQLRGIPILAPAIEKIKMLDRYIDADLMRTVIQGMFTVFLETPEGEAPLIGQNSDIGDATETGPGGTEEEIALDYGAIIDLRPGEKVQMANPVGANVQFEAFVDAIIKQICSVTEIPFEVLLKSFNASYSASRASLLEAWRFFKARRKWLSEHFCQPIFERFMWEAVASGRINAPGFFLDSQIRRAYLGTQWTGPGPGQIDPLKEALAAEKRLSIPISTFGKEAAEMGENFDRIVTKRGREEKQLEENGLTSSATNITIAIGETT